MSTETPWMRLRQSWVRSVSSEDLLRVIAQVTKDGELDETGGDRTETREAIMWLTTRGLHGREWGIAARAAQKLGLFRRDSWPLVEVP